MLFPTKYSNIDVRPIGNVGNPGVPLSRCKNTFYLQTWDIITSSYNNNKQPGTDH